MPAIALEDPHSLARVPAFIIMPGPVSAMLLGSGSFNSPLIGVVAMRESLLVVGEPCEPCKPTSTVDTVFISNMGCSVPASFWYVILLSRTVLVRLFVLPAHDQWRVGSAWEGVRARDGRTVRVSR